MFQVGLESNSCHTTEKLLELASSTGYQFIKANLLHLNTDLYKETPALPLTLVNIKTIHQRDVMATINCCDLDSIDGNQSRKSQLLFTKQIEWAQHLGLNQVVFEIPTGQLTNFSRTLMHSINVISFSRLWLKVGICDWNQFNTTRMACGSHKRLNVLLDFNETESNCMIDFEQWVAEPVQGISLAISRFIKNEKGYPVLSKLHQEWIIKLLTVADTQVPFKIIVNLAGEKVHFTGGLASIQQYLNHLFGRARGIIENTCIYKSFGQEFYHVLQVPLQPLYHNLASATYEVFEQDPVKYNLYEVAIFKAICDWNPSGGKESDLVCVIMVLGVGRGPLVDRVLKAANRAQKQVRVYALEKNSNAILELQEKAIEWDSRVSLVHSDMRYWEAPEQCDIMVSELLGSFGDNELSPECLDGAKKLLKPNAISIPTSYSSFISPISSSTLYEKVCDLKKPSYFETGMVVKFTKFREIAKSEKVWEFVHPQKETLIHPIGHPHFNIHNNRYSTKEFEVSSDTILHGIAGYFECVLYKDVTMSINPSTHSPDMTSWFPMYFPLREPIFLTANSKLSCSFWRTGDTRRVWYEWSAVQIVNNTRVSGSSSFIHNQNGTHSWYNL